MSDYKMKVAKQPKQIERSDLEAWETAHPLLKVLNDNTLDKDRGYEISRAALAELSGNPDEKILVGLIAKWKQCVLLVRGITVVYSHRIKGYRFLTVGEHLTTENDKQMAGIERKLRSETARLGAIHSDDMSDHENRRRLVLMQHSQDSAAKLNSQRTIAFNFAKRPETLPKFGG